jgi:hypothetical protein
MVLASEKLKMQFSEAKNQHFSDQKKNIFILLNDISRWP